jgi:DNA-binding HxlR family transcriptional regulator
VSSEREYSAIPEHECRVFRHAAELTGKKWSAAILLAMEQGAERFSDIRASVDGLSDRLLTLRLRELEQHGLVHRTVIPTVPTQVHYGLTPAGSELIGILQPLIEWTHRWEPSAAAVTAATHSATSVGA